MRLKKYIFLFVFLVLLNYVNAACSGTSPPSSGNWVIADITECSDMEITLDTNADINVTGNLTFTNVNLTLNGTADGLANISVYSGGKFTINASNENQLNKITSFNTANEYAFVAWKGSILNLDRVNISEMSWTGANNTGGLYINTYNASITNSYFTNNFRAFVIDLDSTTPSGINMANVTISNSGSNVFFIWDSLNGATFENIDGGSTNARAFTIGGVNNTFNNLTLLAVTVNVAGPTGAGISRRGDATTTFKQTIFRNSFIRGTFDEAYATTSNDNFHDIFINSNISTNDTDNNDVTILFTSGTSGNRNITFINTSFNQSDVTLDSVSFFDVRWFLDVTVNSSAGSNLSGARVEIYNVSGYLLDNITTDSTGRTNLANITEYMQSSSGKVYFTNISINVSYPSGGYNASSKSINLTSSRTVNVELAQSADLSNPNVTAAIPSAGSSFYTLDLVEIASNITDDIGVSSAYANITYPNSTITQLTLSNSAGSKYNNSFTVPNLAGLYNVTYYANDTSNNVNTTLTTNFTASSLCSGTSPPTSGIWQIDNTTVCSAVSITLGSDSTINITGNLTLTDVNLTLRPSSDGGANITVHNGGKLVINSTSESGYSNKITSNDTANEYAFVAWKGSILRIDRANISEVGWTTANNTGGLYINTYNASITNSYFTNNFRAFLVDVDSENVSDIDVANVSILNSGSNAFYLWDNTNGATFENINMGSTNARGIVGGGHNNTFINVSITGSTTDAGQTGAALWRRGPGTANEIRQSTFIDCTFISNVDPAYAISSSDYFNDTIVNTILNNTNSDSTISINSGIGIVRRLTLINSSFVNLTDASITDGVSFVDIKWFLDVTVNSSAGSDVEGAVVRVYNSTGALRANKTTDSSGSTELMNITEFLFNTTRFYETNVTINVTHPSSQYSSNIKSINLTSSRTVNVELTENDVRAPSVTNITPVTGQSYSATDTITLTANITDDTTLGNSTLNITRPDGTIEQYNLTQISCHEYEQNYTVPSISGTYTATFIGTDFYGNKNISQTITFTVGGSSTNTEESSSPLVLKGGGGGSTKTTTASGDCGDNCESEEESLNIGDRIKFDLNGIQHILEITEISNNKDFIRIKISAHYLDDIIIKVNVGETISIDVNRDGTNDIKFSLQEITKYLEAVVSLESITEPIKPTIEKQDENLEPEISKLIVSDYYVTLGVIVLGLIVVATFWILIKHHNNSRKMFKRKNPHNKRKKRLKIILIIITLAFALIALIIFYSSYAASVSGEPADDPLIVEYNFTTDKLQDVVPFNVTFTSVYENCRDSIEEVNWDFDNDTIIDATGFTVTYQYNNSGNYTANATIVTRNSGNFSRLINITAYNALMTLTFDDSHISQIDTGLPTLDSIGVNATAFMVPEWINASKYNADGFTQWTSYMSWENVSTLNASGWDIQSHGVGSGNYTYCVVQGYGADINAAKSNSQCNQLIIHPQLGKINDSRVVIELNDSKTILIDHGYEIEGIAYPGGNYSEYSLNETAVYYDWGRTVGGGVSGGQSNELPHNLSNNYTIFTRPANDNTWDLSDYLSWVDEAVTNRKWMVWNFHIMYDNCGSTDLCTNVSNTNVTVQYARNNSVKIVTLIEAMSGSWKNETR